jgi:hypothetical protein
MTTFEAPQMTTRLALLAAAGAALTLAAFSAPAGAQNYRYSNDNYSQDVTRCDRDGDRCATYRCDRDDDNCRRVSGWYARSGPYNRGYDNNSDNRDGYYERNYKDDDGYDQNDDDKYDNGDVIWRCDHSGNNCIRVQ